jgi:hypothetical protein
MIATSQNLQESREKFQKNKSSIAELLKLKKKQDFQIMQNNQASQDFERPLNKVSSQSNLKNITSKGL